MGIDEMVAIDCQVRPLYVLAVTVAITRKWQAGRGTASAFVVTGELRQLRVGRLLGTGDGSMLLLRRAPRSVLCYGLSLYTAIPCRKLRQADLDQVNTGPGKMAV